MLNKERRIPDEQEEFNMNNKSTNEIIDNIQKYFKDPKERERAEKKIIKEIPIFCDIIEPIKKETEIDISNYKHALDKSNTIHTVEKHIKTNDNQSIKWNDIKK
jgi:uncharacterized membrane protein